MTIDEAIERFKYDAECNMADLDLSYAKDNEQVAEWLEDYKRIKMLIPIEQALKNEYNKAIDDFVENVKDTLITNYSVFNTGDIRLFIDAIEDVAEQLKAGGENDNLRR